MAKKNKDILHPPEWASKFLEAICPDPMVEEIEGDLIQKFRRDVRALGGKRAKRRFVLNAIRYFRPGIVLRNNFHFEIITFYMIQNYIIIAFRNFFRQKANMESMSWPEGISTGNFQAIIKRF